MAKSYARALSIAGSDPSGGAGIQADLKAFSACGCYGMTAITAVVNENTQAVFGIYPIPSDFITGQIHAVLDDIGADAIKIGMLHSAEVILAVSQTLANYQINNLVLDPVMVATSGDPLLQADAIATLSELLLPQARIITPNIPEAEILLGELLTSHAALKAAAEKLAKYYNVSVLLKSGHLANDAVIDVFYNYETGRLLELASPRIDTMNTHGTGCTLSAALAAFLARGFTLDDAVVAAKNYISRAITAGSHYKIGFGHGPVHHFSDYWPD